MSEILNQEKKRIRYVDALRGFTMLLVVYAHVANNAFGVTSDNSVISSFFRTFRMPMFFFISGYIAYRLESYWSFESFRRMLGKKAVVQIIPATVFCLIYRYANNANANILSTGWGGYWFTIVLFEMLSMYFLIALIETCFRRKILPFALVVFAVAGILYVQFGDEGAFCPVLSFHNFGKYFQFFAFGILCRRNQNLFFRMLESKIFRLIVIGGFVILFMLMYCGLTSTIPLLGSVIRDVLVRYFGLVTLFVFFYNKRDYFDKTDKIQNVFSFVGRRTLDIYLLHWFFIPSLKWFSPYINSNSMIIVQLTIIMSIALLILALCLLVSEVIRTSSILSYYCFGVKKK